jgi:hypothetical protein
MLAKIKELQEKSSDYLNMYEGMIERLNTMKAYNRMAAASGFTQKDISIIEAGIKRLKYSYQKTLCKILEL